MQENHLGHKFDENTIFFFLEKQKCMWKLKNLTECMKIACAQKKKKPEYKKNYGVSLL